MSLVYAQWIKARVHIDYHVEVKDHFYSVPHRLVRELVDVRYTETITGLAATGSAATKTRSTWLQ
jgi:hypothetical protein